jgi:tRNA threonylcarbamoyl adenosine modification protein (Sua5/YciO/YrdC/YwlC family)
MIKQILKHNIDERVIKKACDILRNDGIIACPTDTNWSLFAHIDSKIAIKKLKDLKGGINTFVFTLVCSSLSTINQFVEFSNANFKILKHYCPGPYVFLLPSLRSTQKKLEMKRKELGVRIPTNPIPIAILEELQSPVFAITASKEMENNHWWDADFAEENLYEYGKELLVLENQGVETIIEDISCDGLPKILSTVVDLTQDEPEVIRQGIGVFEG